MWYKLKRILIYPDGVTEKQVYPYKWTPWSNTLLYLPLESDVVDYSWRSISTTASWVSYTTVWWVTSAHIWNTWWISVAAWAVTKDLSEMTISLLFYLPTATYSSRRVLMEFNNNSYCNFSILNNANTTQMIWWYVLWDLNTDFSAQQWINIVYTGNSSNYKLYKNWVFIWQKSWSSTPRWTWTGSSSEIGQYIFCGRAWTSNTPFVNWNIREVIFEKKKRSDADVSKYYQRIKAKLWI